MTAVFEKLDKRANAGMKKAHPKKSCIWNSIKKVTAPSVTNEWMLALEKTHLYCLINYLGLTLVFPFMSTFFHYLGIMYMHSCTHSFP